MSSSAPVPPVVIEQSGQMLIIKLNRPQVINSLNLEMIRLIQAALEIARKEARIHFVLLKGAGERGFCAGGDLKNLALGCTDRGSLAG